MVKFTVGDITTIAEDIRTARELAYVAWFDTLKEPSKLDQFEPPDKFPDIKEFRAVAQAELTRRRGEARRPYITDTYGQELVYGDKEQQAREYKTNPSPTPANYPALYGAEAAALGLDATGMADLILSRATEWRVASDEIEGAVWVAEAGIESAKTHQEILNILIDLDI